MPRGSTFQGDINALLPPPSLCDLNPALEQRPALGGCPWYSNCSSSSVAVAVAVALRTPMLLSMLLCLQQAIHQQVKPKEEFKKCILEDK